MSAPGDWWQPRKVRRLAAVVLRRSVARRACHAKSFARAWQNCARPASTHQVAFAARVGGRKKTVAQDPSLVRDLERLVEPVTRGDPDSPLRWTCKSLRKLAQELRQMGHQTSHQLVGRMLHDLGYSLQANSQTLEGTNHPDRNAQFEYLNGKVKRQLQRHPPVISVDTKKKELVGDFKNHGRELRLRGDPEKVRVQDFIIPEWGRANPYGIYDIARNTGGVSVGVDHDTAAFAVESIRGWWNSMGRAVYPQAARLLITADSGGSNGARVRLWKVELQKLADETGLRIAVRHLPPGTSQWNKIEHRLFSFISQNWRGKPLISHEVIVNLIAATTTAAGLTVHSELDSGTYPSGVKVSDPPDSRDGPPPRQVSRRLELHPASQAALRLCIHYFVTS